MNIASIIQHTFIFITGFFGGAMGAFIGGCSLFTIPALIVIGLPPHIAIATNRFGLLGMIIFGGIRFHQKELMDIKLGLLLGSTALVGGVIGAQLLLAVDEYVLEKIIAIFTILLICFLLFKPTQGLTSRKHEVPPQNHIISISISFFLGIYGGFYGACVATFYSVLLVLLLGESFLQSAATRKIPMFALSLIATMFFMWNNIVNIPFGISLFAGMACGAYIGVHFSEKLGNEWLRRLFIGVSLVLALKLIF